MKKSREIIVLVVAYFLLLPAMFLLPLISRDEYSIIENTLNELGAQTLTNAWIMNFIFVTLALGSVIAGWRYFEGFTAHRIVLLLFGISLILMAFFNHGPVNPDKSYNIVEDWWNAYFSCTATISFIILTIGTSFIQDKSQDRLFAIATGITAIFLAVLMTEADHSSGIWQRIMFIISFGWMICSFRVREL